MKYIEELSAGNCFLYKDKYYLLTIDFRGDNKKLCYELNSGCPYWLDGSTIVENTQICSIDSTNNIIPITKIEKTNASTI